MCVVCVVCVCACVCVCVFVCVSPTLTEIVVNIWGICLRQVSGVKMIDVFFLHV